MEVKDLKLKIKDQKGVTLLLSILIMAALTISAAAVTTFTIQEIRASRANLLSESAYGAAETGIEVSLWNLKQNTASPITNCDDNPALQDLGDNNTKVVYCKDYKGGTINLAMGVDTVVFLYNPDDVNGDVDLLDYVYDYLFVANTGAFAVNVDITRLDDTPVTSGQVNPGANQQFDIPAVAPGSEGRVKVTLSSALGDSVVLVDTAKGLPENLIITSLGCSSKTDTVNCTDAGKELYNRKIEVELQ